MKKFFIVIFSTLILFGASGCDSKEKADKMLRCDFYQKDAEGEKTFSSFFTYVDKSKEAVSGDITNNYSGFAKNEVNNKVLTEILIRNSVLGDVKGVEMEVTSNDTDFGSHESWNYRDVDLELIATTDEIQGEFIDRNSNYYSIEMIQKYYEKNGYSCSSSNIE